MRSKRVLPFEPVLPGSPNLRNFEFPTNEGSCRQSYVARSRESQMGIADSCDYYAWLCLHAARYSRHHKLQRLNCNIVVCISVSRSKIDLEWTIVQCKA